MSQLELIFNETVPGAFREAPRGATYKQCTQCSYRAPGESRARTCPLCRPARVALVRTVGRAPRVTPQGETHYCQYCAAEAPLSELPTGSHHWRLAFDCCGHHTAWVCATCDPPAELPATCPRCKVLVSDGTAR